MYIDCESVYSSSSAVKQTSETLRKKINPVLLICCIPVDFIHSCHYRRKKRKTDFGQSIWPALNMSSWDVFWSKVDSSHFEKAPSFQISRIYSDVLIHSQLSAMFTRRDGEGGKLSSHASKMLSVQSISMCKTIVWRHNMAAFNSSEGTLAEIFNSQFFESSQFILPAFHWHNNKEGIEEALCTILWNMAVDYTRR